MNKFDPVLQEVADKILHDLPEEIAAGVSFRLHEGGDALVLTYPQNLHGSPDMQLLDGVVRGFGGAFVSRGKGNSFYLIPKPKPAAPVEAPKPVETPKPEPAAAPKDANPSSSKIDDNSTKAKLIEGYLKNAEEDRQIAEETFAASRSGEKKPENTKSPLDLFVERFCDLCPSQNVNCHYESQNLEFCLGVLRLFALQDIDVRLERLAVDVPLALGDLSAQLSKFSAMVPKVESPKPSALPPPSQPPKVPRDTNPREGIEEDGLVWVKVFEPGTANLKYLKAYEKDNQGRQRFADLAKWIVDKKDKPFTKLHFLGEECQVFLWNFNQGPPAIGKSRCKSSKGDA